MITIILGHTKCKIVGLQDPKIIKVFDTQMSYSIQGFQFMKNQHGWDGRQRLFTKNHYFPIGLLERAKSILEDFNCQYQIIDNREHLQYGNPLMIDPNSGFKIRDYQQEVVDLAWEKGSGIIKMATGCHRKGQGILMFDGSIKKVEDIIVGDKLMGMDSSPRTVLELCRGNEEMVEIKPIKGDGFVVNKNHILSLKRTRKRQMDSRAGEVVDIAVKDWMNWNKTNKHLYKLFRTAIDFQKQEEDLPLDPYFLGLLLGDGTTKSGIGLTNTDQEVIDYINVMAKKLELKVRKSGITYYFSSLSGKKFGPKGGNNQLINVFRKLNLFGCGSATKFIPQVYKVASKESRLKILAGLIDADGSLGHGFDFISKSKVLSEDISFICRSLGLAAYITECQKTCVNNGKIGTYFRVSISGDCSMIPTIINRKKAPPRKQKKDVLSIGFSIQELPSEDYFGFRVDKDHRYLLHDFTITHNSGKTLVLSMITGKFNIQTVIYVIGVELLYQMKDTLQKLYPNVKIGMVGDGICDIQKITIATIWSAAAAFGKKAEVLDSDLTIFSKQKDVLSVINKEKVRKMVAEAELFVLDECQISGSETVKLLHQESVSAKHRFLFSASPWREDGADLLIESVGGQKIFDRNASQLIEAGWLIPPKIYFLEVPQKHNIGKTYQEVYKKYITENEERNELIIKATKKMISDGRKVLILVTQISHGKHLLSLMENDLRVFSLDGTNKTEDRLEAIQAMNHGKLDVLIASKIFDQGVDIPSLNGLILAGSGKSSGRALQRIGRVIRNHPGKKDAIVVDFLDNCRFLKEHSKIRKKVYETEPNFKIIMPRRKND